MGASASTTTCLTQAPTNCASRSTYSEYEKDSTSALCVCDGSAVTKIRYAKEGIASESVTPATTLSKLFQLAALRHGDKTAFRIERPCPLRKASSTETKNSRQSYTSTFTPEEWEALKSSKLPMEILRKPNCP
jgi:hypothetical protein